MLHQRRLGLEGQVQEREGERRKWRGHESSAGDVNLSMGWQGNDKVGSELYKDPFWSLPR